MQAVNSNKDLNFGRIMKHLRKKQIIIPRFTEERTQMCIELLGWYTAHVHSQMPDQEIEHVRVAIAQSIAKRELSLRDIQDWKIRKEEEIKACL